MKLYEIKTQLLLWKQKLNKAIKVLSSPPSAYIKVEHRDGAGKLLYHNTSSLIDKGDESVLKSYFQAVTNSTPSGFKVGLANDTTIADTATTYTAVTGTGYALVTVARDIVDWTASMPVSTWQVKTKDCVFTAGGTWTAAKQVVLIATLNSVDTLIAYSTLTTSRTLILNDTLTVSIIVT